MHMNNDAQGNFVRCLIVAHSCPTCPRPTLRRDINVTSLDDNTQLDLGAKMYLAKLLLEPDGALFTPGSIGICADFLGESGGGDSEVLLPWLAFIIQSAGFFVDGLLEGQ